VVSGLTLVRFGCGMREPVTTSSWTAAGAASVVEVAAALGAVWRTQTTRPRPAALVIMDDARSLARIVVRVKSRSSEQAGTLSRDGAPRRERE